MFEQKPRVYSKLYDDKQSNSKTVELLPIKGDKGLIKRSQERGTVHFLITFKDYCDIYSNYNYVLL